MHSRLSFSVLMVAALLVAMPLSGLRCASSTPQGPATEPVGTSAGPTEKPTTPPTEEVATPPTAEQAERLVVAVEHWGTESPFGWMWTLAEGRLWMHIYDPLIQQSTDDMEYRPGLFTEWTHSDDYRTWTFKVREGVMFHDDPGELTSDDVKFSLEQNLREDASGLQSGRLFQAFLEQIETPDKYTVVMHWNRGMWELLDEFTPFACLQTITSKKYVEEVGEDAAALHPVGTGPYKHVDGQPGEYHRFEAVEDHWRLKPQFKELVIRKVEDQSTRVSGLRSGEFDVAMVGGDAIADAKDAGFKIVDFPGVLTYFVPLPGISTPDYESYCPECPWVGDPTDPESLENALKVRLALNLLVDKQAIIDSFWHGYGDQTPFSYFYYPVSPGWRAEWEIPPYDPERGKALLEEAGYPDGFEIKVMLANQMADGSDIMEAVAQYWEKAGITVTRDKGDFLTLLPHLVGCTQDFAWTFGYPCMVVNVPVSWMDNLGVGWSWCAVVKDDEIEQKVMDIMSELDETKRLEMTSDLGQELYDGYYAVMIGIRAVTYAVSDKVGAWPAPAPNYYWLFPEYIEWSGQ